MQPGNMASFRDPARDEVTLREGRSSMWLLENSRRMMAAGQEAQALELLANVEVEISTIEADDPITAFERKYARSGHTLYEVKTSFSA